MDEVTSSLFRKDGDLKIQSLMSFSREVAR